MAKYKFILLCAILLSTITTYAQPAQYTPMTAAGYQMKRLKVDSTLHLPSFCGVPTIRGSVVKDGALAIDTCDALLYMWTNQGGWDTINVSGGGGTTIDTTSLSNRINLKLSISDTASMLSSYNSRINGKLNISDTAAMLSPYLRKIDTTNKWVNSITRIAGKDSIIYFIGGTRYAIKDSVGTGGGSGQNGRFGNDTATIVMAKVHNDAGVVLTNGKVVTFSTSGTNSNAPSVKLANNKHDSTSANTLGFVTGTIAINDTGWVILSGHIDKLNTAAFSNGDVIYLDSISGQWTKSKPKAPYHLVYLGVVVKSNAGNGSIFVKCQNGYELSEIHDVQINSPVNNQIIVYSDTQSLWKNRSIYSIVDTTNTIATKSNVALKLNIADTASMLSSYSTRINGKLNISDTSALQRKSIPAYSFLANNTNATANVTAQYFKDTSGTYTGTITWGSSAPTGATTHTYRWTRIGNMVTLNISLVYATVSSGANGSFTVALPADAPTPVKPTGFNSASNFLYPAIGNCGTNLSSLAIAIRGGLRNNAANNGFEINMVFTASTCIYGQASVTYFTN